jgi:signal transduction histidine kinase
MPSGGAVFVETDITQNYEAQEKVSNLERSLIQAKKMEALGTLAGGIAHEINTPIQYIGDNLRFLEESARDLLAVLDVHKKLSDEAKVQNVLMNLVDVCENKFDEKDVEFLREETIQAAEQSIIGVKQVADIVLAMKEFSHPTPRDAAPVDLNRVLERCSVVCKSEWRQVAELVCDFDENLPSVVGQEGALNQAILNLIVNAAHAIQYKGPNKGTIVLRTGFDKENVRLEIEDSGTGIPENIRDRIFEPFFTTKEAGRGTGQGLALVHDIVVNKHGGRIELESTIGVGTKLIVMLPIEKQKLGAV